MPAKRYSILAGFVEPGESLEQTIEREIMEEVGIEVQDIRYFGSQPWPFPCSLMLGFTARWKKGELHPDGEELNSAGWFASDEFPEIPPSLSISRKLIDDFARRFTPSYPTNLISGCRV
jgi:NAD+ diphosphatase